MMWFYVGIIKPTMKCSRIPREEGETEWLLKPWDGSEPVMPFGGTTVGSLGYVPILESSESISNQ